MDPHLEKLWRREPLSILSILITGENILSRILFVKAEIEKSIHGVNLVEARTVNNLLDDYCEISS